MRAQFMAYCCWCWRFCFCCHFRVDKFAGGQVGFLSPRVAVSPHSLSMRLASGLWPGLVHGVITWTPGHNRSTLFGSCLAATSAHNNRETSVLGMITLSLKLWMVKRAMREDNFFWPEFAFELLRRLVR